MRNEQSGQRDLSVNMWHRRTFGDQDDAFDVDLVGICHLCDQPLYAWEASRSQRYKPTKWLERVATMLNIPAYLVTYAPEDPHLLQDATVHLIVPFRGRHLLGNLGNLEIHIKKLRTSHAELWHP